MRFLGPLIFILSTLVVFPRPAFGSVRKEIALHVAILDHMAFSRAAFDEVDEFVRKNLPSRELRSVAVETSVFRAGRSDSVRALLKKGLTLQRGEIVGHLILDTHGSTEEGSTHLAFMGSFAEGGLDSAMADLLEPLRGHLAPDVIVVLNSCSTLCGTEAEAAARVAGLLRSLGAPNAQVYGSTTPEVERPGALVDQWRFCDYLGDLGQFKLFMTLGFALGVPLSVLEAWSHGAAPSLVGVSTAVLGVAASLYALSASMKITLARFGAVNLGRLFVFRGGRLVKASTVEKYPARLEIYATCPTLFGL